MGLDMYLYAKRYLSSYRDNDAKAQCHVGQVFPELDNTGFQVKEVSVEVGYWRKANMIHDWFVKNVQEGKDECIPHPVYRENLIELKELCQTVLDDPSKAEELLPTAKGFFFGSDSYGEWYINDLKATIDIIDRALELPEEWDYQYQSSW